MDRSEVLAQLPTHEDLRGKDRLKAGSCSATDLCRTLKNRLKDDTVAAGLVERLKQEVQVPMDASLHVGDHVPKIRSTAIVQCKCNGVVFVVCLFVIPYII